MANPSREIMKSAVARGVITTRSESMEYRIGYEDGSSRQDMKDVEGQAYSEGYFAGTMHGPS